MADEAVNTVQLNQWVDRMQAGDLAARDELLRCVYARLERLARKMLHQYPSVQPWAETGDVLQSSLLRLLRALQEVRPNSTREFFGLAAEQMRRELLDLARYYRGAKRGGVCKPGMPAGDDSCAPGMDPAERDDSDDLERWFAFHEAVARLPVEEREVVGLIYYHGWNQAEVAAMFQISDRTVRRRWESALVKLHDTMKGLE
jgi:RNA polymerase sigma factor (TIGR02999 family)